jgi:lactate/malate dehydrogenase, alpha/beta C-terminal domain
VHVRLRPWFAAAPETSSSWIGPFSAPRRSRPISVTSAGTFLDSLRFRVHLAHHFDVDADQVEAQVIGEHGTSQVFQTIRELPSRRHDCRSKYDKVTLKVATGAMPFDRLLSSIVGRRTGIIR